MIRNTYFCDTCGKEFNPQEGLSTIQALIPKIDQKLDKQTLTFGGNFCGSCSELIISFIGTLKNELNNTPKVAKPTLEGTTDQ